MPSSLKKCLQRFRQLAYFARVFAFLFALSDQATLLFLQRTIHQKRPPIDDAHENPSEPVTPNHLPAADEVCFHNRRHHAGTIILKGLL
jgi:hypothetical protein